MTANADALQQAAERAARITPHPRQLAWQKLEFVAFFHFTVNTFTDKEWGEGTESPELFNPTELDARQWVRVCRDAGMKQVILTAKHHDGFCLWPSAYTEHSVKNSPWRDGKGDVVREVADACREIGLGFGFYLSPWDRHEPCYGTDAYNEHFRNQLREIITTYGPVEEVWFDGACGEGPNGKRQVYDWESYYRLIRDLAPQAVIAISGPDVRWVGNESGFARETEWSVVPAGARDQDAIAHNFSDFNAQVNDLGSREKIVGADELVWYPAETDVSIRPGWFYHPAEDERVKTPDELVDIYYKSVGRNTVLLLNLPPDRRGLIHENDVANLNGMRRILDQTFDRDFALKRPVTASASEDGHGAEHAVDGNPDTYWAAPAFRSEADAPCLEVDLGGGATFDRLMLQEHIAVGQRVEQWILEARTGEGGPWQEVVRGATVGYKRLERFEPVTADRVRLRIQQSRLGPTIQCLGLFKA